MDDQQESPEDRAGDPVTRRGGAAMPTHVVGDASTIDGYLEFRDELRAALRDGSVSAFRVVIARWSPPDDRRLRVLLGRSDRDLEPIIKRMTLEEPKLADLHTDARWWLLEREPAATRPRFLAPTDARRRRGRVHRL
jgi:hypothetical protein